MARGTPGNKSSHWKLARHCLEYYSMSSGEKYFQARALSTSLSFGTVYIVKSDFTEIYLILAFKI